MLRVIVPPSPFMTPLDIPGNSDANDPALIAMIAAVVAQWDGPDGSLGRCLGAQTLELTMERYPYCGVTLPCLPIIGDIVVKYLDADGAQQTLDPSSYALYGDVLRPKSGVALPALGGYPHPVVIQYRAGYNNVAISSGGTGPVPSQVKLAAIMMVQHLRSLAVETLFLKAEEVEGVGRTEYTVSEQAGSLIRNAASRLLVGLKVPRI